MGREISAKRCILGSISASSTRGAPFLWRTPTQSTFFSQRIKSVWPSPRDDPLWRLMCPGWCLPFGYNLNTSSLHSLTLCQRLISNASKSNLARTWWGIGSYSFENSYLFCFVVGSYPRKMLKAKTISSIHKPLSRWLKSNGYVVLCRCGPCSAQSWMTHFRNEFERHHDRGMESKSMAVFFRAFNALWERRCW